MSYTFVIIKLSTTFKCFVHSGWLLDISFVNLNVYLWIFKVTCLTSISGPRLFIEQILPINTNPCQRNVGVEYLTMGIYFKILYFNVIHIYSKHPKLLWHTLYCIYQLKKIRQITFQIAGDTYWNSVTSTRSGITKYSVSKL